MYALDLRKDDRFEIANVTFRAIKVKWDSPLVWVAAVLDDPAPAGPYGFMDLWLPDRSEVVADSENGREADRDRADDRAAKWADMDEPNWAFGGAL